MRQVIALLVLSPLLHACAPLCHPETETRAVTTLGVTDTFEVTASSGLPGYAQPKLTGDEAKGFSLAAGRGELALTIDAVVGAQPGEAVQMKITAAKGAWDHANASAKATVLETTGTPRPDLRLELDFAIVTADGQVINLLGDQNFATATTTSTYVDEYAGDCS